MARSADMGKGKQAPVSWAEMVVVVAVLAVGAGVYVYAHKDVGAVSATKERGAAIVAALEQYRSDRADYPVTLEELVPTYAAAIEPPEWGLRRWTYRRYTPADVGAHGTGMVDSLYFQLSVAAHASGFPVLYYDFPARRWVMNN